MSIKLFNACMLIGWLLILAGGVVVHPGWGLAIAGGVLMVACLASAYFGGLYQPAKPAAETKPSA